MGGFKAKETTIIRLGWKWEEGDKEEKGIVLLSLSHLRDRHHHLH